MPTPSSQRRGVALLFFVCVLGGMLAAGCPMTRGETLPTVPAQIVEPAGHETAVEPTPAPPRYPPESWMAALDPTARGEAISLACLDANGDLHINGSDLTHLAGFDIALAHGYGCMPSTTRREWFEAEAAVTACEPGRALPVLIVAIGGGGTDLADRDEGVSVGLIEIVNGLRRGALAVGIPTNLILTTAAIEAADSPQARLEQWLAADLARRLDQAPCMRAILIGHSHGAVVVTTVTAALEDRYGPRLLGVLLDRSLLYYDRLAEELPDHAAVLNVYQLNEGWHGEPLLLSNVTNVDESAETAPLEPRDGPEPVVAVAHSTLDDSPGIQARVVERVLLWMVGGRLVR